MHLLRAAQADDASVDPTRGTSSGAPRDAMRWDDGPMLEVSWTDGPRPSEVEALADLFLGLDYDPNSERIYLRESLLSRPGLGSMPRLVRFDVTAIRTQHHFSQQYRSDLTHCIRALRTLTTPSSDPAGADSERLTLETPWGPFVGTAAHLVTYLAAFIAPLQARRLANMNTTDALAFMRWLA